MCVYMSVCLCVSYPTTPLPPLPPLSLHSSSSPLLHLFLPSFLPFFLPFYFTPLIHLCTHSLTNSLTHPSPFYPLPYPSLSHSLLQTYVTLVELLERARQYRAVLALYRVMVRDGYDFYENTVLNGVFKRLGRYLFLSVYLFFHLFFFPPSFNLFILSSFLSSITLAVSALSYDGHFILSFPLLSLSLFQQLALLIHLLHLTVSFLLFICSECSSKRSGC